jgi:hypothetical protein
MSPLGKATVWVVLALLAWAVVALVAYALIATAGAVR